jgi:hypothetical protein
MVKSVFTTKKMRLEKKSWVRKSVIGTIIVAVLGGVGFGVYKVAGSQEPVIASTSKYNRAEPVLPKFATSSSAGMSQMRPAKIALMPSKAKAHKAHVAKSSGHHKKGHKVAKSHKIKKHKLAKHSKGVKGKKFAKHHKSGKHHKVAHRKHKAHGHKLAAD